MSTCYYLRIFYLCGVWYFVFSRTIYFLLCLDWSLLFWLCICLYIIIFVALIKSLFFVYFLFSSVCESSLGLSILVSMIRIHGNDYFHSYTIPQC